MELNQTVYYKPKPKKDNVLLILDKTHVPKLIKLNGNMTVGREFPGSTCDIKLVSSIASRRHSEFAYDKAGDKYYYIDNNSLNGSFVNGQKLQKCNERGSYAAMLSDGDIIRIDQNNLTNPHSDAVLMIFSQTFGLDEKWKVFEFGARPQITIGRAPGCDLTLGDLMTSAHHATLFRAGTRVFIRDENSTNGVGVNGVEINRDTELYNYDVVRIANTTLIFLGDKFIYNSAVEQQLSTSLSVMIREKRVQGGRKLLLKDINANFQNGDFVLILGGSGAGKTTLIKAILGESKADGKIILNGQDLYKNFKNLKSQIGMVPQFLTLRTNDTVRNTLLDTAEIKLGSKYSKAERVQKVEEVLEHVGIKEHADKFIGNLSGGQQKKVSVANQLIGFQKVFICDEPDSGLDATSRSQQMEILKGIADDGRIVMVISHEPDDASVVENGVVKSLFTKVIVLARNSVDRAGHLAFFGTSDDALRFFGVERLQDIMIEINPPEEGGKGLADMYINKYNAMIGGVRHE